ncbi:hypothetical protein SAY87_014634 [Trapa incisa]|uniref:Uncharacterized protein n=2 Tax=Trapa TaxID=22665 RepID=A0AAN7MYV3_TRANT|nr:hypothetical protein SAY87_014634 [Trapa incisa]KAK4802431.1 hypothetical protein SAY86_000634 [Trapa natans]
MRGKERLTAGSTKLSHCVNESFVEVSGPAKAGLGVSGENETRVSSRSSEAVIHDLHVLILPDKPLVGLNQPRKHHFSSTSTQTQTHRHTFLLFFTTVHCAAQDSEKQQPNGRQ